MALPLAAAAIACIAYCNAKYQISRDLSYIWQAKGAERATLAAVRNERLNIFYLFEEIVKAKPQDDICIWSRTGEYTWREVLLRICQYGNYFKSLGLKPKDVLAIYLQNSPEFIFVWWGLLSIGAAPAFINYNLASDALIHCVKLSGAKILLVDADPACQSRVDESIERLKTEIGILPLLFTSQLQDDIAQFDATRPEDSLRIQSECKIPAAFIYTSGTTGFAKAIPVPMARIYSGSLMFRSSPWRYETDRWYHCMPLYHGTAALSTAQNMMSGISIALGRKFSTRTFWTDVRDSNSTVFVYVGETARYLLARSPSPDDKNHKIRLIFGNGMRPDVWPRFQERFGIGEVIEFFNSTEGMLQLAIFTRNSFGVGTVGHHGAVFRALLHRVYVPVLLDPETGTMYRDPKTGFAVRQPYDKGGEILVRMADRTLFPGYHKSKEQTDKMFAADVFEKGDLYYKSGDALRRDADGLWLFMDRLGDTFRWKGENVSTAEVADVLGRFDGVQEANVYGISLPNHDGRAGCVSLYLSSATPFDGAGLATYARTHLPKYAVPIFLRIMAGGIGDLSSHNNKQDKVKLRTEGVDPEKLGSIVPGGQDDVVWWLPPGETKYVEFRKTDWKRIEGGSAKL